ATLDVARDDARALKHLPISVYVMARVFYYEHIGDENAALELLREATAREETKDLATNYALALYRKKDFAAALKALEDHPQPDNFHHEFMRCLARADHLDHGRDKAYAE